MNWLEAREADIKNDDRQSTAGPTVARLLASKAGMECVRYECST